MATAIQNTISTEEYLAAKFAHTKKPSDFPISLEKETDFLRGWFYAALDSCEEFKDRPPINGRKNANPYPVGTINHLRFHWGIKNFFSVPNTIPYSLPPIKDTHFDTERMTYHLQPISRQTRIKSRPKRSLTFWVNLHKSEKN